MAGAPQVLVVEDDEAIRQLVAAVLEEEGCSVVEAGDGRTGLRSFFSAHPELVVLDIELPALDGWGVLERIREVSEAPVLMLTAKATEGDKVRALRGGADDYLTKPFATGELAARAHALMRRASTTAGPLQRDRVYDDGVVRIDFPNRSVHVLDRPLRLTPLEFRLLVAFVRHAGQVLSHNQLLSLVWDPSGIGTGDQVRVYVGYLRRKFEEVIGEPPIETVRGFGYRYSPARTASPLG
jgi:DNA-binding response OmpR family regulator